MLVVIVGLVAAVVVAAIAVFRGFVRFRRGARAYLELSPDITWRRDTPSGAVYAVLGYDVDVDLLTTYVYHLRHRDDESVLLADLAAELRGRVPPVSIPPALLVTDRILPLLRRTSALPPSSGYRPENRLVRSVLDEEVSIAYIIEGQHRFTFVTEGMQTAWKMERSALHAQALANLRAHTAHILEELGGPQAEYVSLDGLDATRALVADLIVPGGIAHPVLAIPHEHACLIADVSSRAQLAAQAEAMFQSAEVPLSPRLYRMTSDGLRPLPQSPRVKTTATLRNSPLPPVAS
jgi:hypothetical protein